MMVRMKCPKDVTQVLMMDISLWSFLGRLEVLGLLQILTKILKMKFEGGRWKAFPGMN